MTLYNVQYKGAENELSELIGRSALVLTELAKSIAGRGAKCELCKQTIERDEPIYSAIFYDLDEEKNRINHVQISFVCTACMIEKNSTVHEVSRTKEGQ